MRLTDRAAALGGQVLRGLTGAIDRVRPARKPLHPRGHTWSAELARHVGDRTSGVGWIDSTHTEQALVRLSAAVGLPHGWPDVQGIALRALGGPRPVDVLFATTGGGALTRFLLEPATTALGRVHSTLLPYRGPQGPVMLAAKPLGEHVLQLAWADLTGRWNDFATLTLLEETQEDPSYDAVVNRPPGLQHYSWVQRLRLPSYRAARRRRGEQA